MVDISHAELLRQMGVPTPTLTGPAPAPPVRPRPAAQVDPITALQRVTPTGEVIPFDTSSGAPFSTRFKLSLAPDEPTKEAILQQSFSNARIEPLPDNMTEGFIVRDYQDPETGQIKDLLVDEVGLSMKDIADMGQVGVELLGAYMSLRAGRPTTTRIAPGMARAVAEAAIAATGSQIAGGLTDVAGRAIAGTPIDPLEIAQRRNKGALIEAGTGVGISIPVIGASSLLNTWRGIPKTTEAMRAISARNRLAEGTGTSVPFTLGQQTGSERMRAAEAFTENVLIGGGPQRKFRLEQQAATQDLQTKVIESFGPLPAYVLPDKDVVGSRAVTALRRLATEGQQGITTARADAMTEALGDLQSAMNASTGMASRSVLTGEAGKAAQTFVQIKHDALNEIEDQLGAEVDRLVGGKPFIPTPILKRDVNSILKKAYEKPGQPGELMESMPKTLVPILKDIQDLGADVSLDGMRRIRNSISRQISQGEILGDTDTGVLKQLSKTVTDAIKKAAPLNLTPEAAAALKRYNQFYSEGIEGFQVKGITEILADPTQRKLGPIAIFDQAASDPDQYFRLKKAMTEPLMLDGQPVGPVQAGNQAWATFKQAMWQEMTDESRKGANRSLLDPKKLLGKLTGMKSEVRDDLLGPQSDVAMRALGRLEALDNPKLPAEEALDILRQGGDTAPARILELAKREAELDTLYKNQVVKKFIKGDIGSESIRPAEFVDRFADVGPIADVRDTMNKLEMSDPGFTTLIRQKKVQSLFEQAQKSPWVDEASAKKLAKEIRSQEQQARLEVVLGKPGLQRVNDFLDVLAVAQDAINPASKGGNIVAKSQQAKMLTLTSVISALPKQAQYYFTATVLSNPRLWKMATHPVQPLDPTKLVRGIIVTDDFIEGLASEFGREASAVFDMFNNAAAAPRKNGDISHQELMNQINQKARP